MRNGNEVWVRLHFGLVDEFVRPIRQYANFAGFLVNRVNAGGAAHFQTVVLGEVPFGGLKVEGGF